MKNKSLYEENTLVRLRWLMFLRVAIVSFLLGIAAFIQLQGTKSLPPASLYFVYIIIGTTYFLSILYTFLLKKIGNIKFNVRIQSLSDVILITILVYVTGGIESIYSMLYPLVIIYSALFLGRRGGILIASASGILYGLLIDLEFYNVIHPFSSTVHKYDFSPGYVFARIFIYIVSFYIIAFLVSFLVEQEKKTRVLLSEKESAFNKLDLLHRSIIESVNTGIMTVDLQGGIKSFNKAAEEITGFSFFEIKDRNIDDIFIDLSGMIYRKTNGNRRNGQENGVPQNRFEMTIASKDGKDMTLGFSFSPLIDSKGESIGGIIIFQDLTAIKEMEREVEKNKRLALIGEMSAILAHELRSPLVSISGSIQLLEKGLDLEGTDKKLMDIIIRGKDQLESLARDFLLLARPSPVDPCAMDVKNMIDDIIESVQFGPDWNENIEVVKELCDQNSVYGNEMEIRQALWNIALNAVQSMPDGGKFKIRTATVMNENGKEYLEIRIGDTGSGIGKEYLDRILEPFYTTKEKGTGLGLAIVNRVVESHEGKLRIDSELNKGTQCIVLLPKNMDRRS